MQVKWILLIGLIWVGSCKDKGVEPPPPKPPIEPQPTISLEVIDTSATEVWLKVSIPDTVKERSYQIKQNDSILTTQLLKGSDTLMLISDYTLYQYQIKPKPSTTYRYRAERLSSTGKVLDSIETQIRTLDSTSHEFIWSVERLGDGFSILRDACIINDTCIWVVGKIDVRDTTTAEGYRTYNAARWDGTKWNLVRHTYNNPYTGNQLSWVAETYAVWAYSPTEVWIANGNVFKLTTDTTKVQLSLDNYSVGVAAFKLWGTSPNNIYAVGGNGTIAHYNGTQWTRMESGTTVQLSDVYGTPDGKEVWACGTNSNNAKGVILRLKNGQWEKVWSTESRPPLFYAYPESLWMTGGVECYILDLIFFGQIYLQPLFNTDQLFGFKRRVANVTDASYKVRGSSKSNVVTCGFKGNIFHFNGSTWKNYHELINVNRTLYGLAVSEKQIIAVGIEDDQLYALPIVVRGRRP